MSSDLLGATDPLEYVELVQDEKVREWELKIYEKAGAYAGRLKITSELIPAVPDPPLIDNINYNCQLEIKMVAAEFLKDDGDAIGKQDPFLAFDYDGLQYKTEVQDDAGKSAKYNDVFLLENIEEHARSGKELTIQAFDHDVGSCDLLGSANPKTIQSMCVDEIAHY